MLKKIFRRIGLILLLLWFMLTLVVGMWVWSENSSPVVASYFGFEFHDQALGTVMAAMFVAGFLLGAFPLCVTVFVGASAHRRQIKKMLKEFGMQDSVGSRRDTDRVNRTGGPQVADQQGSNSDNLKLKA